MGGSSSIAEKDLHSPKCCRRLQRFGAAPREHRQRGKVLGRKCEDIFFLHTIKSINACNDSYVHNQKYQLI